MRIAVIGSGVSGIAAARVLARFGHDVIVYERTNRIGGVWVQAYPRLRLQNVAEHYRLSDFPWPFPVDRHPTAEQILRYLEAVVSKFGIDVRLGHEVTKMRELAGGWQLEIRAPVGEMFERFDHSIVAVGQYSGEKTEISLPGRQRFRGQVFTERDLHDLAVFEGKRVVVVGFGKTAVDLATFAAERGASVHHVFRAARWLLPRFILGRHISDIVTTRVSTFMLPAWNHFGRIEALIHKWLAPGVRAYWKVTEWIFRAITGLHPLRLDPKARAGMRALEPGQPLRYQMRAAAALAPDSYYSLVSKGAITPRRGIVSELSETALLLADGEAIPADIIVLAIGYKQPAFPFLPEPYRSMMTGELDGVQLYRHLLHPRIPRLAFAGFNHGFLHVTGVEVSMIWYGSLIGGNLALPSPEMMEASAAKVAEWKRKHTLFEPTRAYGVGIHFHHYLDVLLAELGVRHRRKKNALAEQFEPYVAEDYAGVFDEFEAAKARRGLPLPTLAFDT
ncbi:MAG: flavin-containing monooxygenase [Devosia sp.]